MVLFLTLAVSVWVGVYTGKKKVFIRSSKTLFELQQARAKFLESCAKLVPNDEQIIFADKVTGYDQKSATECLLLLTANSCRLMTAKGRKTLFSINLDQIQGMSMVEGKDMHVTIHCKEVDIEENVERMWDVLVCISPSVCISIDSSVRVGCI